MNAILTILVFVLVTPLVSVNVNATQVSGDSQVNIGDSVVLNLTARPTAAGYTTAQISLNIGSGLTVAQYIPPLEATWGPEIGTCSGGALFTAQALCVDLTKATGNTISDVESLGVVVLNATANGNVEIRGFSDNGYLSESGFDPHVGLLFNVNVGNVSSGGGNTGVSGSTGGGTGGSSSGGGLPTTNLFFEDQGLSYGVFFIFVAIITIILQYVLKQNILERYLNTSFRSSVEEKIKQKRNNN